MTMSTASRLSTHNPCVPRSQPMPPESVRPATPVCETSPPGVARPKAVVSRSTSAHRGAALHPGPSRRRIDPHCAHRGEVDHQPAVAHRVAGDVVSAAAHRQLQTVAARKADALDHVRRAGAAGDEGGVAVDHAVPHHARGVVAVVAGFEQAAAQPRPQGRHVVSEGGRGADGSIVRCAPWLGGK